MRFINSLRRSLRPNTASHYRAASVTLLATAILVVLALASSKAQSRAESLQLYGLVRGLDVVAQSSRRKGPSRGFRTDRDLLVARPVLDAVPIIELGTEPALRLRLVVSP